MRWDKTILFEELNKALLELHVDMLGSKIAVKLSSRAASKLSSLKLRLGDSDSDSEKMSKSLFFYKVYRNIKINHYFIMLIKFHAILARTV